MESYIELAEKYNKLLKEQNQLLKDSIQREDEYSELNNKYINVCAKADVYEEVLKNINSSLYPISESEYRSWHNDTRQAANEALSGEREKVTPEWIEWLCDGSPDVPDLSDSTEEEKKLLVDTLFQSAGIQFMKMFYAVGLEKFMESGLVNDSTGDLFRLRFELMQKGHKENQKEDKQ